MRRLILVCTFIALAFGPVPNLASADGPYDYVGQYSINDATREVYYHQTGQFLNSLECPGVWNGGVTTTPTTSAAHSIAIKVSTLTKQYAVEEQKNFVKTTQVMGCTLQAVVVPLPTSCGLGPEWQPRAQPSSHDEIGNGWTTNDVHLG